MTSLQGKTVFITGASAGIGAACAEIFAKNGARVLLCARREERLQALAAHLQSSYACEVHAFACDMAQPDMIKARLTALPPAWQQIDVLVNNAGFALGLEKFQDSLSDDWEQMIDVNVKGVLYVTHAVLQGMLQRGQGHVINVGSISALEAYPKGSVYCASKFAIDAFSKGLTMDLLESGIRVTAVHPGKVHTEFSEVRFKGDKVRALREYDDYEPLVAADIADTIYFCATRPAHVNIREITVLPTAQASATMIHKE